MLIHFLRKIARAERGATAVEYGLICALVILGMMVGLINFAHATVSMWNNVTTSATAVM